MQLAWCCLCSETHQKYKIQQFGDYPKLTPKKSFFKKRRRWKSLHSPGNTMFFYFATLKGTLAGGGPKYAPKVSFSDETRFCFCVALVILSCMYTHLHSWGYTELFLYVYIITHIHTYIHTYIHTPVYVSPLYIYIYIYIYMHRCVCVKQTNTKHKNRHTAYIAHGFS